MQDAPKTEYAFSPDLPIETRKQDRLGRSKFVERLSTAISGWRGKGSLVIAVYGEWGNGKTSVKNLLIESLNEKEDSKPQIVEFNPWQWASQDQITEAFFKEVGAKFGKKDKEKKFRIRAAKWKAYGEYLKTGSFIFDSLKKLIVIISAILALTSFGNSFLKSEYYDSISFYIGIIALLFAGLIQWGTKFTATLASAFEATSKAKNKSLSDLKKELEIEFEKLKNPILVVVDDIDRLSSNEVRLIFQLIKANCNFSNLIYLLLFQRDIVEKSLEGIAPKTNEYPGRDFLEKIVQIGITLPLIEKSRLNNYLTEEIKKLFANQDFFKKQRWFNIFNFGISHFFNNLRDVSRFVSTLSFYIALFKEQNTLEVNPIDLIALEVLRVFEPTAYNRIREFKTILVEDRKARNIFDQNETKEIEHLNNLLFAGLSTENRNATMEILKMLFPKADWLFHGYRGGYSQRFEEDWLSDLRVCNSGIFDRYFLMAIPEGDISQADLDRFISHAGNRDRLLKEFRILKHRGLVGALLNRLEYYKQKIDIQFGKYFVTGLFDITDELPKEVEGLIYISPFGQISKVIYWYLKQEENPVRRGEILLSAIADSNGVYMPLLITAQEIDRNSKENESDSKLVDPSQLNDLKYACLQKIRKTAETDYILRLSTCADILDIWQKFDKEFSFRDWIDSQTNSEENLLLFLSAYLEIKTSNINSNDGSWKKYWILNWEKMQKIIDLEEVERKINSLHLQTLSTEKQRIIRAFKNAKSKKDSGKKFNHSDTEFYEDEEFENL